MTDENEGKGGSYVIDPATGERKLVDRTVGVGDKPEPKPKSNETDGTVPPKSKK